MEREPAAAASRRTPARAGAARPAAGPALARRVHSPHGEAHTTTAGENFLKRFGHVHTFSSFSMHFLVFLLREE